MRSDSLDFIIIILQERIEEVLSGPEFPGVHRILVKLLDRARTGINILGGPCE